MHARLKRQLDQLETRARAAGLLQYEPLSPVDDRSAEEKAKGLADIHSLVNDPELWAPYERWRDQIEAEVKTFNAELRAGKPAYEALHVCSVPTLKWLRDIRSLWIQRFRTEGITCTPS